MSALAVRCDRCGSLSRVPEMALGKMAICPQCRGEFVIRVEQPVASPVIPTVYPVERSAPPLSFLYGLAISAFLVPFAWLLAKILGAAVPVFTLGLPLAIAVAAAGLGVGVSLVTRWSFAFRVKAILILLGLAWGLAAMFFFLKPEWVEAMRRDLGLGTGPWREFRPPSRLYRIQMPGSPRKSEIEIVRGWSVESYRFAEKDDHSFAFVVGHGAPREAAVGMTDDQFFAAAREGASAAANGQLLAEKPVMLRDEPGREFIFKLADQATNRTVRVYRVGTKAVVAMAEGAFLPPDAKDVRKFFDSLSLTPRP